MIQISVKRDNKVSVILDGDDGRRSKEWRHRLVKKYVGELDDAELELKKMIHVRISLIIVEFRNGHKIHFHFKAVDKILNPVE